MSADMNKIDTIRRRLKEAAAKGQTVTYVHLADLVDIHPQNVSVYLDAIWDAIQKEESPANRLDLTLVVVKADIKLPGKFNDRTMDAEDWDQETLDLYCKRRNEVYEYYRAAR